MLEFQDGRICVQKEDMERTEWGKELLKCNCASHHPWITLSKVTLSEEIGTEITAWSTVWGPDWGKLALKLKDLGTICVREVDLKRTELGKALLERYRPPPPTPAWPQMIRSGGRWVYSQVAHLPICGWSWGVVV